MWYDCQGDNYHHMKWMLEVIDKRTSNENENIPYSLL